MSVALLNVPVGTIIDFAGASTPEGYLECDGRAVGRSAYAALFAAIGTLWGAGNGSTTFNVPDLRGRCAIGAGTGNAGGATAHALASKGGDERMQSHTHTISLGDGNLVHGGSGQSNAKIRFDSNGYAWTNNPSTLSAGGVLSEHAALRHGQEAHPRRLRAVA